MGAVSPVAGLVEMGMGVYQKKKNSKYQSNEFEYQARGLEEDAYRKEVEADAAIREGATKSLELHNKTRRDIARQKVSYAAAGVKIDSGSTLETVADHAAWGEYGRQKLAYESEMRSWGLRRDAALLRGDAATIRGKSPRSDFDMGYELFRMGSAILKG